MKLARFCSAVFRPSNADLAERYRGFDATKLVHAKTPREKATVEDHRSEASWALNDVVGCPPSAIELL